jgi:hypothetical protein
MKVVAGQRYGLVGSRAGAPGSGQVAGSHPVSSGLEVQPLSCRFNSSRIDGPSRGVGWDGVGIF